MIYPVLQVGIMHEKSDVNLVKTQISFSDGQKPLTTAEPRATLNTLGRCNHRPNVCFLRLLLLRSRLWKLCAPVPCGRGEQAAASQPPIFPLLTAMNAPRCRGAFTLSSFRLEFVQPLSRGGEAVEAHGLALDGVVRLDPGQPGALGRTLADQLFHAGGHGGE